MLAVGAGIWFLASSVWADGAPATPAAIAPPLPAANASAPSPDSTPPPSWLTAFQWLLAPTAALIGVALTQRHQTKQEALKDARALRDQRFEREAAVYEDILAAAWAMSATAHRYDSPGFLPGETRETREAEAKRLFFEVMPRAERAQVRLALDQAAGDVRPLYQRIWSTFVDHQLQHALWVDQPPGTAKQEAWKGRETKRQDLDELVAELEEMARERLGLLRQPVTRLADVRPAIEEGPPLSSG